MRDKNRIPFQEFLHAMPANNYILQEMPYEDQVRRAAEMIREADHVLLGAGAGMSAAAGAVYGGKWFEENFREFRERYGTGSYMRDMYSAGFYPYPSEEAYWGYWSKQCMLAGITADHTALHRRLLQALKSKHLFCLSTNTDGQFVKAGLPAEQIFCAQGDYFHIQCAKGCHQKRYEASELFMKMDAARENCLIPASLVPKCPVCGGRMNMNLRIDEYFVQDQEWYEAEKRFEDFLSEAFSSGGKTCLLELGVGFNTPGIIRYPFENLVRRYGRFSLVRLNMNDTDVPECIKDRAVGIDADLNKSIGDIFR